MSSDADGPWLAPAFFMFSSKNFGNGVPECNSLFQHAAGCTQRLGLSLLINTISLMRRADSGSAGGFQGKDTGATSAWMDFSRDMKSQTAQTWCSMKTRTAWMDVNLPKTRWLETWVPSSRARCAMAPLPSRETGTA